MKQTYKAIVENCLQESFNTRDSDPELYSLALKKLNIDANKITGNNLIFLVNSKVVPSYVTIVRLRQRLQQLKPELRGATYDERNTYRKQNALKDLGYGKSN
jgi:hypothetical protein